MTKTASAKRSNLGEKERGKFHHEERIEIHSVVIIIFMIDLEGG
jgi:hypothetical protein